MGRRVREELESERAGEKELRERAGERESWGESWKERELERERAGEGESWGGRAGERESWGGRAGEIEPFLKKEIFVTSPRISNKNESFTRRFPAE